jgi:hypothetical protein
MTSSIQFGVNNEIVNTDLETHIRPSAMSDRAKTNIGIAINQSDFARYQQFGGSTQGPSVHRIQTVQSDGSVAVGNTGLRTDPTSAAHAIAMDPSLADTPADTAAKVAAAQKIVADEKQEADDVAELNRFVDPAAEAAALHVNSDVSLSDRTQLLWQLHSTGTVNGPTLQRVAEQMYLPVDQAVEALNAIHTNHSFQVATLCGSRGVDAQAFGSWAKAHRSTEMFHAVQKQANDRDFVGAWSSLVDEFKARGQK